MKNFVIGDNSNDPKAAIAVFSKQPDHVLMTVFDDDLALVKELNLRTISELIGWLRVARHELRTPEGK